MRVLLAPDSYGGFCSAVAACAFVGPRLKARGLRVSDHPMADGGEGFLSVLGHHAGLAPSAEAWRRHGDVVAIESARLLGRESPGMQRPCLDRSSHALGRLLIDLEAAGEAGPYLVGLGGTSTLDGGVGALAALGLVPLDSEGRRMEAPITGADLERVHRIVGDPPLAGTVVALLADVRTPIVEAPRRFGLQKGLPANRVGRVEAMLHRWAGVLAAWREENGLPPLPVNLAGGGAAGGLGYALAVATGGPIREGAPWVARTTGLEAAMDGADVVITGEGRLDATSFEGKVVETVLRTARRVGSIRVAALVGEAHALPPGGPDLVEVAGSPPDLGRFLAAADRLAARLAEPASC
ncbi:MAG: glycerate kinase [Deltaproteobacteria bacterium]|nr:glycerate kinase [Deltaproteobacteria bacterium]